ncbi:MAG TPA: thiamine-phosphate kinase, partial [Terriglobales bacterium]|nr:thiamine-phosphate kinase [Terriglobales bacterium]
MCLECYYLGVPSPEKQIIARIRALAGKKRNALVRMGIGDDGAVLRPKSGSELLVTTDFSLEGTHFRRDWHPAHSVGHRCLARGLSDIAAMGGEPHAAFLSLALPARLPQSWVDGFLKGFLALANLHGIQLAGGDVAESKAGVLADVMIVGSAPAGKAVLRSGARNGDILYVTGALGGVSATLRQLLAGKKIAPKSAPRHFFPEPRVEVGRFLREKKFATAMIDLSDGLSTDLAHVCSESGVGAVVNEFLLPISKGATLKDALHG